MTKSLKSPDFPVDPNKIRGNIIISCYKIDKVEENSIKVSILSEIDMKSNIPPMMYKNMAIKEMGSYISLIKEEINKY